MVLGTGRAAFVLAELSKWRDNSAQFWPWRAVADELTGGYPGLWWEDVKTAASLLWG